MHELALSVAQTRFGAALRSSNEAENASLLLAGSVPHNERRLAIYRGNAVANTRAALRAHYPVVVQIVGDEFFDALARAYWERYPSTSGDLGDYGEDFAAFVVAFDATRSLPYLGDLARVEWAVHRAETAADTPPAAITREPALLYAPGSAVFASAYPIADIWRAHQPDAPLLPEDIVWVAQGALIYRDGYDVRVAPLAFDEAQALVELLAKESE